METGPIVGRVLLVAGVVLAAAGALLMFGERIPLLGTLPGDVTIARGNVRIFLPLGTGVALSLLASALVWLMSMFRGK